ncbi:vacuolar import and degradation protein [Moesziomyces antarcticus T-34]|uniref:Vacuolar import and degradation protein n=1 Tax=Pseudozyma antarctica (strain T-34) TaxID=1151754 RepID=M9LV34_PSEA3|nr:vacuolar import and degradation protein [Moesziomyces antarcticus T-34]
MTPGPSFTMPAISRSASADPLPRAATATTNDNAAEPRPSQADQASASTHHPASVTDEHMAHDRTNAAAQPKHCARCGQLLDLTPASNDTAHPHASSSSSIPAPSPSSYAFAPDSVRSHHRIQPHQSLTSAINAAAAVALSRHLGTNDDILVTDSDGHAICTHCSAQLADSSHDPSRSTIVAASSHEQPASSASLSVAPAPTRHTDTQHAPDAQIADTASEAPIASTSADTNGPQMRLTISVNNMGAGGDAPRSHSIDDVTMHDPSAFPPLERAPASPALRAPSSPPPVARSTSRTRIRFADASTHRHPADANGAAPATQTDALARSGSFSRSLSYNGPGFGHESVSASSAQVVVSFPPANASALAPDSTPALNAQAALSFAPSPTPSAAAMAPSTPQQSRSRSSSHLQASGNSHAAASHAHVPAPANAIPGGAKQRRPSSARRLSRSGSSTGPTTLPFAAVGADPASAKDDDPYGPSAMTRPRLSLIPRHVIADTLYYSAHAQRPASLGTTSTSTSLSMPSAALAHTFDPTRAVKYHADPLALRDPKPEAATGARGTDEEKQALGVAAKWGDVRWFDPYKPDPLAELSRLRTPPKGRGCLYPGATFNGTQKSGRNSYDVTVRIVNVDLEASHLCGYLNIRGLTEDWPELTTYFDAEIIGDRYGFVTGKWGATEADDLKHWARFPPFRPLRSALSKPGLRFHHANKPFVFMRWKEKFLVPDHRVRDINGASFAGFYYVCVELGESAAPPGRAEAEARQRSNSNVSMTSASGHASSSAASPILAQAGGAGAGASVSGPQWYAARTQRRRELSLSAPGQPHLAHIYHQQQQQGSAGYHPQSPPALQSGPGFWPASPTSPQMPLPTDDPFAGLWAEADADYDDLGARGKMSGFYFHENSEPYQQLSLHHTPEASSCAFEMR